MKIIGKYGKSSLDIEGSVESLRELSRAIQGLTGSEKLSLFSPPIPPTPYLGYARSLRIDRDEGKVCISRMADEIIISGSPETLVILARNIERLAEGKIGGSHEHIEYHPGHFYLKENSTPLVITWRETPE